MGTPRVELTDNGFNLLEKVILSAEKYIFLASFLFYNEKLAKLLMRKRRDGLDVKLITTPSSAARTDELKKWSQELQGNLVNQGVDVFPCDWEVGQPQRTTSTFAGGRSPTWFALHMKFLVTDKHAVVMSADLTKDFHEEPEWDSFIVYDDEKRIGELRQKFDELHAYYLAVGTKVTPEYIDSNIAPRKLLKGYPLEEQEPAIRDGFYLLPLDSYGRPVVEKLITSANQFIYCVYETFYDDDLNFLILKKLIAHPRLDFKILGPPLSIYQQNPLKARANFVQLASYGAEVQNLEKIRAKLMITDKGVIGGSFDLSVMGLGKARTEKGLKVWVESTEILDVNTDSKVIQGAKKAFLALYEKSSSQYGDWFLKDAVKILQMAGAEMIAHDAKNMMGLMIFRGGQQVNDRLRKIALLAIEIAKLDMKKRLFVRYPHVIHAEQILLLDERGELDNQSVAQVLGILKAGSLTKKFKEILSKS